MSLFSKLFGGGASTPEVEPETHNGFRIIPEPIPEGGQFRLAARIEKEVGGETRSHKMIRADTFTSAEDAVKAASAKARQVIDEQGERLFN
ncbi:HlyU family transcriptional regulator [Oceanibium sediminis]|uniref:HlyU family transcriptional regulator n=1 Tax=Oceanibium sediminis TaxID=2026339 RepID=UPI000DD3FF4E|nr:HlyU family transcriptional regulator [Oceanibium sediminis]